MKFSLKTLAAAVVMAAAATGANAAIDNGGNGNGDLFLNLVSASSSYTRDLGFSIDTFQGKLAEAGNINLAFTDSLMSTWLGQQTSTVEMNIFAVDASGSRRFISTFSTMPATRIKNNVNIPAITDVQSFLSYVNPALTTGIDSATFAVGTNGYAGKGKAGATGSFNDSVFGSLNFTSSMAIAVGNQLNMLRIDGASTSTTAATTYAQYMEGTNAVKAYFTADNVFHIAAVPEPEQYAMLLAGLGMLGFIARRRGNRA